MAKQAVEIVTRTGRDIPVVVVVPEGAAADSDEILQLGARDTVLQNQPDRFRLVITRELEALNNRRALRRCEKLLHETEKRARDLIDSSRDAIAYVHEGMHINATGVIDLGQSLALQGDLRVCAGNCL